MAHINSFVRLPLLALRHKLHPLPRIGITGEDRVRMRVWPNDIDFNFHLNNSRFLTCMDYARMHQVAATGIFDVVLRHRWMPLVGSVYITYRRPLHIQQVVELGIQRGLAFEGEVHRLLGRFAGKRGLTSGWGSHCPSVAQAAILAQVDCP